MIHRRRVVQMAAAAPALGLTPWLTRFAAASGDRVGSGATVDGAGLSGIALSWTGARHDVVAHVRALVGGHWTSAVEVRGDHGHGPVDPTGREHSAPVVVPGASAYRIDPTGAGHDLRSHPIASTPAPLRFSALSVVEPIPGLEIIERDNWAILGRRDTIDCTIRSSVFGLGCRADVGLRHGVVHHTVSVNDYAKRDVAGMIRAIQTHHMENRGWDDIAYNFVVDRFGRIWHARDGDLFEPISGGHTLGFNAESIGVAVLGTFSDAEPTEKVVSSLGRLLGWKLGLHGVDPLGSTVVRSSGGDQSEPGEMVPVANVSGHRDLQHTTCPGDALEGRLDDIRADAAELVPVFGHLTPTFTLETVTIDGWAIDRFNPEDAVEISVSVDGAEPTVLTADEEWADLDEQYPAAGVEHGFSMTIPIDLHTTSIVVECKAADDSTATLMNLKLFATFIDVEPDRFFASGVWFLREKELTTGTLPGLFEPMDEVSRAQMATFLHRFMDSPEPTAPSPFDDVPADTWFTEAVAWLFEAGITTGTSATEFSPDEMVSRAQMAAFLWRLCGRVPPSEPAGFDDVLPNRYYAKPVDWLKELGITTGLTPKLFGPDETVTRGQMAAFLERLATTPAAWIKVDPPSVVDI